MSSLKSIKQYNRSLSDRESRILSHLSYNGKTIFTKNDVRKLLKEDPRNVLDNLRRKRWILKIKRGVYAIAPLEAGEFGAEGYTLHSFAIASSLVEPYYIGYWSALNFHGLTDQTSPAVYIATTKPRNSRKILNTQFNFVTVPARKMFGKTKVEIEKREVNLSSREKTLVDCLDHPEHSGGIEEAAKAIYFFGANAVDNEEREEGVEKEIDFKLLVSYARRLGNNTVLKRLGYIAEALEIKELVDLLSDLKLANGYSLLDPTLPKRGKIRERWKILVNTTIDSAKWK